MKKLLISLTCTLCNVLILPAQEVYDITMDKAISIAQDASNSAKRIQHNFNASKWNYKIYRASVTPSVSLNGTLPDFNRSITPQLLPDGTQNFISYHTWNSDLGLRIAQTVPLTGGQVYVSSNIQQIVNVELDDNGTSYFTNPVAIGFNQNLTGFNEFRWRKKTEPMKLEEAGRDQVEKREQLSLNVVRAYFNYLLAQDNLRVAELNLDNNEELYRIAKGRYNLGKIAENDLLQMELSVLQASISVENSSLELQRSKNELFSLLNLPTSTEVKLSIPEDIQPLTVDPEHALEEAKSNRKDMIGYERRLLEADMNVAEARANQRPQLNLFGSFGLNQSATDFQSAYQNPVDQERFNLGVQIPIYNGGQARSYYKIAQSERDLATADVQELKRGFERDVKLKAKEIALLDLQIKIAAKSDTIATKRYEISRNRYLQGKIDITELNLSQQSKDNARLAYIAALRSYWESYYELRMLTLFDYRENKRLYVKFE